MKIIKIKINKSVTYIGTKYKDKNLYNIMKPQNNMTLKKILKTKNDYNIKNIQIKHNSFYI